MQPVRAEELILAVFLVVGYLVALSATGTVDFETPFNGYSVFLIKYFGYTFVFIRPVIAANNRWELGSETRLHPLPDCRTISEGDYLETEMEVIRGGFWLTAALVVYTNIKVRVPILAGKLYDGIFLTADYWIFGSGFHDAIIGLVSEGRVIKGLLDIIYAEGYFLFIAVVFVLWLNAESKLIRILFNSYAMCYLIGIFLTVLYPSYGPFFFEPEKFEWLDGTQVENFQAGLRHRFEENLRLYENHGQVRTLPFTGIAAFPSLHIAHMTVISVVAWRHNVVFGFLAIVLSILAFVATIAFGWHYAVDGLGGVAIALFCTESIHWWVGRESATAT